MPRVNRSWPVWLSSPIRPIARPKKRLANPRAGEAPSTAETVVKASTMTAKYSAGPNLRAMLDDQRRHESQQYRGDGAGNERTDRCG